VFRQKQWRAPLGIILLSLATFLFYTWHNDFLFFYHTDEPGKVTQVMSGERKFNHPLLLLTGAELIARARGGLDSAQVVVTSGRIVSAAAAAIAVGLLTVLGIQLFGPALGFLLGVVVATNPLLFELGHYMKEDCCLIVGVSAVFAALAAYERRPSNLTAALLGAACGLAISGKYIGSLTLLVAVPAVFFLGQPREYLSNIGKLGILLAAAAVAFLVLDYQAIMNFSFLGSGVGKELSYMDKHAAGRFFQNQIFKSIPEVASLPLMIFAGLGFLAVLRKHRETPRTLWAVLAFAVVYLFCIHFTPLARERYLLPVVIVMGIFSMAGLRAICQLPRVPGRIAGGVCAVALLVPNVISTARLADELKTDSRKEIALWIAQNIPMTAVFAVDDRSHFREYWAFEKTPRKLPVVLHTNQEDITLESPAEFRKQGVTHVLVTEDTYQAIVRRAKKDKAWDAVAEQLFPPRGLLWQSPKKELRYIHPGLRLYVLPLGN